MKTIQECKKDFIEDLINDGLDNQYIINKHLIFGTPYVFQENEALYFDLKHEVSNFFCVDPSEVFMVGSGKLGFSISPTKLWNEINDESDIDIVIISERAFDEFWDQLLDFNINLTARSSIEQNNYQTFLEYFFRGWLRPDKFPFSFDKKNWWFDFFRSISYKKYDGRKIAGAIYRNREFFNKYHSTNLHNIRVSLKGEIK